MADSDYPEHDKLTAHRDEARALIEFHEFLESRGIFLAQYVKDDDDQDQAVLASFRPLIAEYFGIDEDALEAEKRTMLATMVAANNRFNAELNKEG